MAYHEPDFVYPGTDVLTNPIVIECGKNIDWSGVISSQVYSYFFEDWMSGGRKISSKIVTVIMIEGKGDLLTLEAVKRLLEVIWPTFFTNNVEEDLEELKRNYPIS